MNYLTSAPVGYSLLGYSLVKCFTKQKAVSKISVAHSLRNGCSKIQRPLKLFSLYFAKEASPLLTPLTNPCNGFRIDFLCQIPAHGTDILSKIVAGFFHMGTAWYISFPFHVTYFSHNMLHTFPILIGLDTM